MESIQVPSQNKRSRRQSETTEENRKDGDSKAKKPRDGSLCSAAPTNGSESCSVHPPAGQTAPEASAVQNPSDAAKTTILPAGTTTTVKASVTDDKKTDIASSSSHTSISSSSPAPRSPTSHAAPAGATSETSSSAPAESATNPPVAQVQTDPQTAPGEVQDKSQDYSDDKSTDKSSSSDQQEDSSAGKTQSPINDDSNIGNESDSDLDYEDLDDLVLPDGDNADDDLEDDPGDDDDQGSVASSTTTASFSSVGSNTPSLVGESLESVSLGGATEGPVRKQQSWVNLTPNLTDSPALRRSLFSNIPPTINFMLHNEISAHQLPEEIRRHLKWRLSNITPAIVKRCAGNSGFRLMRRTCNDWCASWTKHMKSVQFKEIKEGQKINHFPGTFNIGRKDRLWKNYHRLMIKFGKSEFGFLPRTFILPADTKLLKKVFERRGGRGRWIVKPPALARGIGISVVNKWSQIPKQRPLVVQRYVARPYLINETKFDLRLYLLVTSINPLRLYLYDDGLVRFASNKYTNDSGSVGDVYVHLTNYSINKNSGTYTHNEESHLCQGHKWTLKSLWRHFDEKGIDHSVVWEKIKDLMIKTVISAENSMSNLFQQNVSSRYSCYELFGFDILLDSKLKPWLIEVNISPSLHSQSNLDLDVKSPLATEVFNMARYHIPNKLRVAEQKGLAEKLGYSNLPTLCMEKRLYVKDISKAERAKHDSVMSYVTEKRGSLPPMSILDNLTPDDTRQLLIAEDELATSRRFQRIFPTAETQSYFKYCEKHKYYNLLLAAWEQRYSGMNREAGRSLLESLCQQKHHLRVPATVYVKKTSSGQQAIDISGLAAPTGGDQRDQQLFTPQPASAPAGFGEHSQKQPEAVPTKPTEESDKSSSDTEMVELGKPVPAHAAQQDDYKTESSAELLPSQAAPVEADSVTCTKAPTDVSSQGSDSAVSSSLDEDSTSQGFPANPSHMTATSFDNKTSVEDERMRQRLSCGSEQMDWGSITPSPRGTPEHPGYATNSPTHINSSAVNINALQNGGKSSTTASNSALAVTTSTMDNNAPSGGQPTAAAASGLVDNARPANDNDHIVK